MSACVSESTRVAARGSKQLEKEKSRLHACCMLPPKLVIACVDTPGQSWAWDGLGMSQTTSKQLFDGHLLHSSPTWPDSP